MLNLPKYVFNFGYMINIDLSIRVVGEICNQPHQLTTESSVKALAVFFLPKLIVSQLAQPLLMVVYIRRTDELGYGLVV